MSDEPSSSAAAAAAAAAAASLSATTANRHDSDNAEGQSEVASTAKSVAERRRKNRILFNQKRGELLDDLLRNLDILIYAELSAIYYMDNFFFRFCLRAFMQFLLLTPKPAFFPETPPNRPYVGAIFGGNILCIILHIAFAAPSASDATRGYLHGGLAMDFVGQKGPSSKMHLVLLDVLVLILQVTHLSGHLSRQKVKDATTKAIFNPIESTPVSSQGQTLEDEERGVRRSGEDQRREEIELQTLNPSGAALPQSELAAEATSTPDRASLLAPSPPRSDAHIFDAFNSGQIVLADLNLPSTVAEQFWVYQKISWDATQTDPTRFLRQRLSRGGMRWRFDPPSF